MDPQKAEKHTDLKHLLVIVLLLVLVGALVVWVYISAGPNIFSTQLKTSGDKSGKVAKEITEADDTEDNPVKNSKQAEDEINTLDEESDLKDIDDALNQLEQVDLSDIEQTYQ